MDQMKNFFHHWLGLAPADAPPAFIMRGINALRADELADVRAGNFSAIARAAATDD